MNENENMGKNNKKAPGYYRKLFSRLQKIFPALKKTKLVFVDDVSGEDESPKISYNTAACYMPTSRSILFPKTKYFNHNLIFTLLHEVRHALQHIEGEDFSGYRTDTSVYMRIERDADLWAASNLSLFPEIVFPENFAKRRLKKREFAIGEVSW